MAHLPTSLAKKLYAPVFPSPSHAGKDRQLDIIQCTGIFLGKSCLTVDYLIIVQIPYLLVPSQSGIIEFRLNGTDAVEILLAYITYRYTTCYTLMHILRHLGVEADITQNITAADTYTQILSVDTNLSLQ